MAYQISDLDDEDLRGEREAEGEGSSILGQAQFTAPAGQPYSAKPNVDSGSSFVNFDQYFNANADAAKKSADRVAQNVTAQATGARQNVDKAAGAFGDAVTAGTNVFNPGTTLTPGDTTSIVEGTGTAGTPTTLAKPVLGQTRGGGLQSTPQRGPGSEATAAPMLTPGEAETRAAQKYSGPTDFTQVENYADLMSGITRADSQVKNLGDSYGLETLARQNGASTAGGSWLDAALMGRAGRSQFDEVGRQFADLDQYLSNAGVDAGRLATDAEDASEVAQGQYGGLVQGRTAEEDTARAEVTRALEAENARVAGFEGKKSWNEYSKFDPWRIPYQAKRLIDPVDWAADLFGFKNPMDGEAAKIFTNGKKGPDDNYSNMIDFGAVMPPGLNDSGFQERVYDSMTNAELAAVGKMSRKDQQAWISARMKKLGLFGPAGPGSGDATGDSHKGVDPNTLDDAALSAQGFMHERAPGESYAHYSDRVAARKKG